MLHKKWPSPLPEPGSAKDRFARFVTKIAMVPFGVLWIGFLGFAAVGAARKQDICTLLGILGAALWFGFITWSALAYAFTGYYPVAFIRLWNATWGWMGKRIPVPPPREHD